MLTKILIVGFTLAVVTVALPEIVWDDARKECVVENGSGADLDPEAAAELENCVLACTMKGVGTMTEDGVFAAEKIINILPKVSPLYERAVASLRKCAKVIGKNDCETAALVRDCVAEEGL